jgi:DNA mismatch repair ATPase MutL
MTMYALPAVNALMQKYSTVEAYLQSFVQHFCQHQLQEYHKQKAQQPGQAAKDSKDTKDTGAEKASAPKSAPGDEKTAPKNPESAPTNNPGPNNAAPETTSENPENLEKYVRETEMMAVAIFNKVLTDSVLYYLFVTVKLAREGQQSGAEGSAEGKESSDSKLSVIFQAFLQTAAFSYQQSASEETPDEAEAPTGGAAQDATEEGLNGGLD